MKFALKCTYSKSDPKVGELLSIALVPIVSPDAGLKYFYAEFPVTRPLRDPGVIEAMNNMGRGDVVRATQSERDARFLLVEYLSQFNEGVELVVINPIDYLYFRELMFVESGDRPRLTRQLNEHKWELDKALSYIPVIESHSYFEAQAMALAYLNPNKMYFA